MELKMKLVFGLFGSVLFLSACKNEPTEVAIISSIHGLHKTNPNYSYDDLFEYIEKLDPDLIGVEIRKEDIDSSVKYLQKYYPFEMIELREKYEPTGIRGIDWLGKTIEGKAIPENYFKELDVIQLQIQAGQDSSFQNTLTEIEYLAELKNDIASSASITGLNNGEYDSLNSLYYKKMDILYQRTAYEKLFQFYQARDANISKNIHQIVETNRGKRMIFVVGADHRSHAVFELNQRFGSEVTLLELN